VKARTLINRRLSIGSFIATICGTNMNSEVPQCKMCIESKMQNASSVIAPINPSIITNLHGVVKLMKKLTLLG